MSSSAAINDWLGAAQAGWRPLVVLMLLAAVSSVITTAWLANSKGSIFVGVVFGLAITCGLAIGKALPNPFSAVLLIFASAFADYVAFLASWITQMALSGLGLLTQAEEFSMGNPGSPSPIALLVGGLVGGFLLSLAFLFAVTHRNNGRSRLRRALLWSIGSAGLAVVGWALSPLLGPILSHFVRAVRPGEAWLADPQFNIGEGPIGMVSSVYFTWQIGMAFAMGLAAQRANSGANQREITTS